MHVTASTSCVLWPTLFVLVQVRDVHTSVAANLFGADFLTDEASVHAVRDDLFTLS